MGERKGRKRKGPDETSGDLTQTEGLTVTVVVTTVGVTLAALIVRPSR